jgi:hypothetical protein
MSIAWSFKKKNLNKTLGIDHNKQEDTKKFIPFYFSIFLKNPILLLI